MIRIEYITWNPFDKRLELECVHVPVMFLADILFDGLVHALSPGEKLPRILAVAQYETVNGIEQVCRWGGALIMDGKPRRLGGVQLGDMSRPVKELEDRKSDMRKGLAHLCRRYLSGWRGVDITDLTKRQETPAPVDYKGITCTYCSNEHYSIKGS